MSDEYWGTFSIYDHRHPALFRNSLILFDRVVIPVPTETTGDLQEEELEALAKDAEYLQSEGAAIRFDWSLREFEDWQWNATTKYDYGNREMLAEVLMQDPAYASRVAIAEKHTELKKDLLPEGVDAVTAIPVYGTQKGYDSCSTKDYYFEQATLEMVLNHFPMPSNDTPLEEIVRFRHSPQFRDSLYHLRKWQTSIVRELLQQKNDARVLRAAARDLERWIIQYNEEMADAKFKKVQTGVISILALGTSLATGAGPTIAALATLAPPLFNLRELVKPCWKRVSSMECAPAGVIYAASQLWV